MPIVAMDPTWCYWCDRPKSDCCCHLDPNGIPDKHWSREQSDVAIPPYPFVGPFAYSLRCVLCRMETPHTQEQHDILRCGIEAN